MTTAPWRERPPVDEIPVRLDLVAALSPLPEGGAAGDLREVTAFTVGFVFALSLVAPTLDDEHPDFRGHTPPGEERRAVSVRVDVPGQTGPFANDVHERLRLLGASVHASRGTARFWVPAIPGAGSGGAVVVAVRWPAADLDAHAELDAVRLREASARVVPADRA